MTWVLTQQDLRMFGLKLNRYISNFQPEVMDCGSETQLQMGEKFNFNVAPEWF